MDQGRGNSGSVTMLLVHTIPLRLCDAKLNVVDVNRKTIVYGKLYKDACLQGTVYVQFKSWAKTIKTIPYYSEFANGNAARRKEFRLRCQLINDCAVVYDNWGQNC